MQLAAIDLAHTPDHGFGFGTVRRGGPDAPPPAHAVAQAVVELPLNFGAHARLDVTSGRTLGSWSSIEEARSGARELADAGATTIGVLQTRAGEFRQTFRAVELLVPNVASRPVGDDDQAWQGITNVPLRLGRDATIGNRFVEELWAIDRADADAWNIVEVVLPGRGRLEFEHLAEGRRSRLDLQAR